MIRRWSWAALIGLFLATEVIAQHPELWDVYPAEVVFVTVNDGSEQSLTQDWRDSSAQSDDFATTPVSAIVRESIGEIELSGVPQAIVTDADWQWIELAEQTQEVYGCTFTYRQWRGARAQTYGEGYRVGQREQLAWDGASGDCAQLVAWYIDRAQEPPAIPFHLSSWPPNLLNFQAQGAGWFEFRLIHKVVKTRRLLRAESLADLGADPAIFDIGSIGEAPQRFEQIQLRLQAALFEDRFEANP